jgi:hypothetical protein
MTEPRCKQHAAWLKIVEHVGTCVHCARKWAGLRKDAPFCDEYVRLSGIHQQAECTCLVCPGGGRRRKISFATGYGMGRRRVLKLMAREMRAGIKPLTLAEAKKLMDTFHTLFPRFNGGKLPN